ncbi:hypothetical protein LCGC14_0635930 [marine sediment metagenome]|uniref:Uncharacterized protein n=1 Tax=marine sediment metagenome TaxID=412755 RepID=A0A0F9R0F5_9ZZZZ
MPIKVKHIKTLREEDCYASRRLEGYITKICEFLEKHSEDAFTPKEITEGLTKEKDPMDVKPIRAAAISFALSRIKRIKKINTIQHKGNYYWFEEKNVKHK